MDHYGKISPEEYLMHYGVKGMKWGVRKDPQPPTPKQAARMQNKIERLESKNKRIGDQNVKRGLKKAKRTLKAEKLHGKSVNQMAKGNWDKAAKYEKKANKRRIRAARYEKRIARGNSAILKNQKMIEKLNMRLSMVDSATVSNGAKFVEAQFLKNP